MRERPHHLQIMLAEDEPLIALLLEDLLEAMGHTICAVETTEAGVVATGQRTMPDLIIADCRLREGSGIRAVETILKERFVPHIFMSGDVLRPDALDPAAVILRKPFFDRDLSTAIDKALMFDAAPP